ncbi:rap1 GTPase-GDP dissociation stimulator 1 isoform X2 [Clupea harengus]|uniref:Rap1 GTPase-GDP dissociation stimulator 1 isoform X2 n=1 Tax=Clupea harengus TaxID=7950 RepID=A0A6P8EZE8_CLUHA|nr:rap1 GTPase-GDP dissociation stimulator 1 isoform X2 [Clupea harengus]
MAKRTTSRQLSGGTGSGCQVTWEDSLGNALNAIRVSTELIEEELRPHLDTLLTIAQERKKGVAEQVVENSILPVLAQVLWRKNCLTLKATKLVAELAREPMVRERCFHSGISSALLSLLSSSDQELLLHTGRAIGRIGYDNTLQQEKLLRNGVVPRLASVLLRYPANEVLVGVCLLAFCSLADMGEEDGSSMVWERAGHAAQGEWVFRGMSRNAAGSLSSTVTVVRLHEWSTGQYMVTVEVLHRCSTVFWSAHNKFSSTVRWFPMPHLTGWPKFYKVVKYSAQGFPQNGSWTAKVFHTLL